MFVHVFDDDQPDLVECHIARHAKFRRDPFPVDQRFVGVHGRLNIAKTLRATRVSVRRFAPRMQRVAIDKKFAIRAHLQAARCKRRAYDQ